MGDLQNGLVQCIFQFRIGRKHFLLEKTSASSTRASGMNASRHGCETSKRTGKRNQKTCCTMKQEPRPLLQLCGGIALCARLPLAQAGPPLKSRDRHAKRPLQCMQASRTSSCRSTRRRARFARWVTRVARCTPSDPSPQKAGSSCVQNCSMSRKKQPIGRVTERFCKHLAAIGARNSEDWAKCDSEK